MKTVFQHQLSYLLKKPETLVKKMFQIWISVYGQTKYSKKEYSRHFWLLWNTFIFYPNLVSAPLSARTHFDISEIYTWLGAFNRTKTEGCFSIFSVVKISDYDEFWEISETDNSNESGRSKTDDTNFNNRNKSWKYTLTKLNELN